MDLYLHNGPPMDTAAGAGAGEDRPDEGASSCLTTVTWDMASQHTRGRAGGDCNYPLCATVEKPNPWSFPVISDARSLCREGVLVPLPGLSRREVAKDLVFAQSAALVERLDEGEDFGAGGGPVGPDTSADLFLEQGPGTLRCGVVEA